MARKRHFRGLARWLQSCVHPPEGPGFRKEHEMTYENANNAFAAIAAFAVSVIVFAAAIVPASPAGLLA